jgi:hypothetical protein
MAFQGLARSQGLHHTQTVLDVGGHELQSTLTRRKGSSIQVIFVRFSPDRQDKASILQEIDRIPECFARSWVIWCDYGKHLARIHPYRVFVCSKFAEAV